jgi:hypothetical protein
MNTPVNELEEHPIRLVVDDDLRRNRLTVFFRLILAIPHYVWYILWSIAAYLVAILNWFATLITGRPPRSFHRFLCAYIRYGAHLSGYLYLAANPYPGFTGEEGEYEIDIRLPHEPQVQVRWKTFLRLILGIPSFILGALLGGGIGIAWNAVYRFGGSGGSRHNYQSGGGGGGLFAGVCAFFGWFASLVLGRMPKGLRDGAAYGIGYGAQVKAYALLVTDRYPNTDPTALLETVERPPLHPVHLVGDAHDLRRSRVTVFFRLPLVVPHLVWLSLWSIAIFLVSIVNWFATLITGAPPQAFHRFISAYLRYQLHVYAFLTIAANPFPGFTGAPGRYPLDLALPEEPQRQNRWKTAFRGFLGIPGWVIAAVLLYTSFVAAFFTWFVALFRGVAPWGLRNLIAYALRYQAQLNAYLYLVTDRYPHTSPLEGEDTSERQRELETEPLAA